MKSYISLEEGLKILDENIENNKFVEVKLIEAIGLKSFENVYSDKRLPPFNKSAVDGYAIRIEDNKEIKRLKVIDKVFAGGVSENIVTSKEAIRIMTGAKIPKGANAVIKQEDVIFNNDFIQIDRKISFGNNICLEGEDIEKGDLLIEKGKLIDYADIGILASIGIEKIKVYRKPKIAIFTTGDEIIDIDKPLVDGKIYNSNKYLLLGRLKEMNLDTIVLDNKKDDIIKVGNNLKKLSEKVDLIITTGGVSVGERDILKEAISYVEGKKLFWKINIKPGSAVLASKIKDSLIISLSGNPTAALTTFELLVKPSIDKLIGEEEVKINKEKAFLKEDYINRGNKRRFVRGNFYNSDGKIIVDITQKKSGNGIITSTKNSNCIIEFKNNKEKYQKDELVDIIKL